MNTIEALMAWSGGKDSAMALSEIRLKPQLHVLSLFTTITTDYDRVTMHGVRRELVENQAKCLGLPLHVVFIPKNVTIEEYQSRMQAALLSFQQDNVSSMVFGDIFLQDVRQYREDNMARAGMKAVFPLWGRDTRELARSFVKLGFKATVTCVNSKVLDKSFCGRMIDDDFLNELPPNVDPCGENGEYHSFVFDGPGFQQSVRYKRGEIILRDSFHYCDLLLQ